MIVFELNKNDSSLYLTKFNLGLIDLWFKDLKSIYKLNVILIYRLRKIIFGTLFRLKFCLVIKYYNKA